MKMIKNAIGHEIPKESNGRKNIPFKVIYVVHELLGNGRSAGNDPPGFHVLQKCPGNGIKIDSRVSEKAPVFGNDCRLDELGSDTAQFGPLAVTVLVGQDFPEEDAAAVRYSQGYNRGRIEFFLRDGNLQGN